MFTFKTSRVFSSSAENIFAAFESPNRLAKWWGPDGFTNSFDIFEFKPGGIWRFTMHGPDGTNYLNESTFVDIQPARKIILKHLSQPHFQLTISLDPTATGTLITWEQVFEDEVFAAEVRHIIEPANEQNLNRWQAEIDAGNATA